MAQLLEKCFDVSGVALKAEKHGWKGPGGEEGPGS
jgi:hypothetical protein